jgi:hypothetical protein
MVKDEQHEPAAEVEVHQRPDGELFDPEKAARLAAAADVPTAPRTMINMHTRARVIE